MRKGSENSSREAGIVRKALIILGHAVVGWALCAATMGIGMMLFPLLAALIIHAIGAPIFFAFVSWSYFSRFRFTTPAQTAALFVLMVVFLDFFTRCLRHSKESGDVCKHAWHVDPVRLDFRLHVHHGEMVGSPRRGMTNA